MLWWTMEVQRGWKCKLRFLLLFTAFGLDTFLIANSLRKNSGTKRDLLSAFVHVAYWSMHTICLLLILIDYGIHLVPAIAKLAGIGSVLHVYMCMSNAYAASARAGDTLWSACGAEETDINMTKFLCWIAHPVQLLPDVRTLQSISINWQLQTQLVGLNTFVMGKAVMLRPITLPNLTVIDCCCGLVILGMWLLKARYLPQHIL